MRFFLNAVKKYSATKLGFVSFPRDKIIQITLFIRQVTEYNSIKIIDKIRLTRVKIQKILDNI